MKDAFSYRSPALPLDPTVLAKRLAETEKAVKDFQAKNKESNRVQRVSGVQEAGGV